jgi:hypothetical protein
MKLKFTLLLYLICLGVFAQQKSIGPIALTTNMNATITLDNGTSMVTLSLSGPNDRWFALQFGSFSGGMEAGADLVYWNNVTLVDARHNGVGVTPTDDAINNWVLVSNTNNLPSVGLRTLIYKRPFNTGDANDFTFNFADTTLDLAWARFSSPSFVLSYHGMTNRGVLLDNSYVLGLNDFSLANSILYPNPTNGNFIISTKKDIEQISVYNITGTLIKTIAVENNIKEVEVDVSGLLNGIYFLELKNDSEKAWKKIIIN